MLEQGETMPKDFLPWQFRDKKGSRLFPVVAASNAAAEHPLHQQWKDNPKASGQFKWQGLSLRVVGEAKEQGNTNKT